MQDVFEAKAQHVSQTPTQAGWGVDFFKEEERGWFLEGITMKEEDLVVALQASH